MDYARAVVFGVCAGILAALETVVPSTSRFQVGVAAGVALVVIAFCVWGDDRG